MIIHALQSIPVGSECIDATIPEEYRIADGTLYSWAPGTIEQCYPSVKKMKYDECPCCGSRKFKMEDDYYQCEYCDSMFGYE